MNSRTFVTTMLVSGLVVAAMMSGCSSDSNKSTNPAPVTEPFESGNIPNGGVFVHTFPTAGNFGYRCRIHSGMTGTITVDAAAANDSALVTIGNRSFSAAAPIKPGGKVRWLNGGPTHTVSRP